MKMMQQRGLLVAVSTLVVALLLLGRSSDASRFCAADRSLGSFDREGSFDEESSLQAELDEEARKEEKPNWLLKQPFPDCGLAPGDAMDNITDGTFARMFAPLVLVTKPNTQSCAGVILSPRLILTHANCTKETLRTYAKPSLARVRLNYLKFKRGVSPEKVFIKVGVSKICANQAAAVLRLDEDIKFNKLVHSACLPDSDLKEKARVVILHYESKKPREEEERSLLTTQEWACPKPLLDNRRLCLNVRKGSKICSTDQGAPVLGPRLKRVTIFGILTFRGRSRKRGCLKEDQMGFVYDNVFKLRAEIDKLIDSCK